MNKFKFLLTHGLKRRLFKKSFIITNAILGLLIIAIVNVPAIISLFDSDDEAIVYEVLVINETTDQDYALEPTLLAYFNQAYEVDYYQTFEGTIEDYEAFWAHENLEVLLVFSGDLNQPDIDVYIKDAGLRNHVLSNIQAFLNEYQGINYANYTFVEAPSNGDDTGIDDETRMFIEGMVSVLVLPVFFLIIMATQFLGVDIIEEKSSKAIETIIASVPSKIHFLSKIATNISFLIIQSLMFMSFGVIGLLVSRTLQTTTDLEAVSLLTELASRIPNWPSILVFLILFMIVGTLFFLTLAALIASIATTQEDYQQFQAPLVFTLLGSFYIAIFLPMLGADTFIRIAAYIPLFTTLVAPVAYATGVISLFEAILILVLMSGFVLAFMYYIAPIYRVAILSYEETKFFKRIKFYIKKAFAKTK